MDITIRLEQPADYRIVEELTREAFWGMDRPDCDEHLLAHKMRKVPAFIPELDFVAEAGGIIVGNIMYTKSKIIANNEKEYETLNFGPLSVLPKYKNCGIGKALMTHSISEAQRLGYRAILFFGHPDYYPQFGFKRAKEFNITTSWGANFDAFMAMPLFEGALDGISGGYYEDPVFEINEEEKNEFDKEFPYKERCVLPSADVLNAQLPDEAIAALKERKINSLVDLRRYSEREVGAWDGINISSLNILKATMIENGYPWGERINKNFS